MRSLPYDIEFRRRARLARSWGLGLLAAAALLWIWFGVLLLTPYDRCQSRLFTERPTANDGNSGCAAERDWPELLGVLGFSVPVAVGGAVLFVGGGVSNRMAEHLAEVTRLSADA